MSTNGHHPADPEYWTAYLAASIAHALAGDRTAKILRTALQAFMGSPCCTRELAETIRKTTKGEA